MASSRRDVGILTRAVASRLRAAASASARAHVGVGEMAAGSRARAARCVLPVRVDTFETEQVMRYEVGDYVIPSDLPRRWTCRVEEVERKALAGGETIQILTLAPVAGPWRAGTLLVRLDGSVEPAPRSSRTAEPVARAAAAARRACDGKRVAGMGKVIRLPIRPKRLPVPEPVVVEDAHE
jgi:hypothetical protein